ncbi:hypothetical protein VNO77_19069 [Canavalia gladiata]|uniref:Uncharacterized protein n=1 Tax=Canavalia gladiata TaxID=3824 RepID=A0AAN9LM17_CANGL
MCCGFKIQEPHDRIRWRSFNPPAPIKINLQVQLCREKKGSDEDRLRGKLLAKDGASRRIAASSLGRFLNSVPSPEKLLFSNLVLAIGRTLHSIP